MAGGHMSEMLSRLKTNKRVRKNNFKNGKMTLRTSDKHIITDKKSNQKVLDQIELKFKAERKSKIIISIIILILSILFVSYFFWLINTKTLSPE